MNWQPKCSACCPPARARSWARNSTRSHGRKRGTHLPGTATRCLSGTPPSGGRSAGIGGGVVPFRAKLVGRVGAAFAQAGPKPADTCCGRFFGPASWGSRTMTPVRFRNGTAQPPGFFGPSWRLFFPEAGGGGVADAAVPGNPWGDFPGLPRLALAPWRANLRRTND